MKRAVALTIYRDEDREEILSVLRPENDEDHPGVWGMPATSLKDGESWEDAVHRAADEKLGVDVNIKQLQSEGFQHRENYDITLRNYEVEISLGQPDVDQKDIDSTKYVSWDWKPIEDMKEAATETASLCTSLLLNYHSLDFDEPDDIYRKEHNK